MSSTARPCVPTTMNMLGPHFLRPYKPQGGCYKRVWEPEFPTSLGVCTCNIYNGLTPASLRGDAAVSYGADACNTPNYVNTLLLTFALIAVYVLPLPELLSYIRDGQSVSNPPPAPHMHALGQTSLSLTATDTIHHTLSHVFAHYSPTAVSPVHSRFLVSRAPIHPFTQSLLRRHRRVCRADAVQGHGQW